MRILQLQANSTDAGSRLDCFLARALPELSRSAAARLLEAQQVTCGGVCPGKSYRLTGTEQFTVTLPEAEETALQPEEIPLEILYEDEDIIVINKPKGLVVHPAPGHSEGTLVNALLHHCGDSLSGIGGEKRPGIVHRIDKDTSGLLVAAKNDFAHRNLTRQLSDHTMFRTYECLVTGHLPQSQGTVDAPIGRHPVDRKKMAVTDKNSRRAVTHYQVLAEYAGYSHVRCRLETGRTHQIRVHMAYLGHPIWGDTVYGAKKAVPGLTGQCLHATGLELTHPRSGERMRFSCPLPAEFLQALEKLKRK